LELFPLSKCDVRGQVICGVVHAPRRREEATVVLDMPFMLDPAIGNAPLLSHAGLPHRAMPGQVWGTEQLNRQNG
jgi:hypothetical protein